jgi:transcriptional regulator with XRE-family HTH domain
MENNLITLLGGRIREIRTERGYTNQSQFAELIGLDAPRLSRIESGKRGIDTLVLRRAAQVLDVPMDAFFERPQEVALARVGEADDPALIEMLEWTRTLHQNIEVVGRYVESRG